MPKSARLRVADIHALHRLVGECRDLGDAPTVWWPHFSVRLAGLAGADFSGCGELAGMTRDKATTLGIGEWGWENGVNREPWDRSIEMFDTNPEYTELYRRYFDRQTADDGVCLSRPDLMRDREWEKAGVLRELVDSMGIGVYLWCYKAAPGAAGHHSAAVLGRLAGRPDFSLRAKALVRAANELVAPMVGGPLASFVGPSPADLPPRTRLVLKCFLEGDSDKQVAARLGIGVHTVNEHAKRIHHHFGVTTRAELLARWVKRGWGARFAWADEP